MNIGRRQEILLPVRSWIQDGVEVGQFCLSFFLRERPKLLTGEKLIHRRGEEEPSQSSSASVWTPDLLTPSHILHKNGRNDKCKPSCFDNSWANGSKSLSMNAGTDEVLNNQGIYYCHSRSILCMVFLNVTEFFPRKLACQIWIKQEIGRTSWQKSYKINGKSLIQFRFELDCS